MRLFPTAFAAALALALPAAAQQQQQPQRPQQSAQLSPDAHHVIGKEAMNPQGKEVGKVRDVLIGQDGKVQALIIDAKGKKRAVPWDELSMRADQLTINMSDQQLSQLPEYKGEKD